MATPTLDDILAALSARNGSGTVDHTTDTPVPAGVLRDLVASSNCRAQVEALRDEMRDELDEIKAEQKELRKLIEDLPRQFAALAFEDRDADRKSRSELQEKCFGLIERLFASNVFVLLLGISVVLGSAGVFLSQTGIRVGDWLEIDASRDGPAAEANQDRREENHSTSPGGGLDASEGMSQ